MALGFPAACYVVGTSVYSMAGGRAGGHWLWPPENAQRIAALIVFPIGEEFGWRGVALPRLQRRYSRLTAALVVGVGWAVWHIPMLIIAGSTVTVFAISAVSLVALSIFCTWLFNHTQESLLLAILAHAGGHLNNPTQAFPNSTPFIVYALTVCVAAIALVVIDRKAWRKPE